MVDILDWADGRQFWVCGAFRRFAEPRTRWSETAERAAAVDDAEVVAAEAHDMSAIIEFGDAHQLADERLADEGEVAAPLDFPARAHAADLVVGVVPGVPDAPRHGARRGRIKLGRRPLPERFVRALLVIVTAEHVEPRLLLVGVGGRRLRR